MSYKMLALDLDDTLLNEHSQVSERNQWAVSEAIKCGILVTIATGRMFCSARRFAAQLKINSPIISYHGALIKSPVTDAELWHRPVPPALAKEIIGRAEDRGFHVNLYIEDRLYAHEENEYTRYYEDFAGVEITPVGDLKRFVVCSSVAPTKLTIIDWHGRIEELESELNNDYEHKLSILQSRPYFLEITDKEATKGQALRYLSENFGIRREESIAVGDSYNDLDMVEFAGLGVAVANARREVQDAANIVTATNVEDGVAMVIEEFILKKS
ncbi:MAG: HAD family phosphatase [Firmicutes bacterium]|nr:HAD family phosphatase [Bacillota bacterium]